MNYTLSLYSKIRIMASVTNVYNYQKFVGNSLLDSDLICSKILREGTEGLFNSTLSILILSVFNSSVATDMYILHTCIFLMYLDCNYIYKVFSSLIVTTFDELIPKGGSTAIMPGILYYTLGETITN